ncbi:hypothetical protein ON010_g10699 [Phytophthora cinnamomi]|nr:hypothetical protein ON010_g10699 [Phytophthora cinnamomi]
MFSFLPNTTVSATAVLQVAQNHAGAPPPAHAHAQRSEATHREPSSQGNNQPEAGIPAPVPASDNSPVRGPTPQRNGPPRSGVSIGDLLNGSHEFREDNSDQHEDQPGSIMADEDSLELVREAYNKGVRDPEQLLRLAENAQPTPLRDAPFSVQASFGGNLQNLSRPKIIANLKLIDDNPIIRDLLDKQAIVHVHKLPRNRLMFQKGVSSVGTNGLQANLLQRYVHQPGNTSVFRDSTFLSCKSNMPAEPTGQRLGMLTVFNGRCPIRGQRQRRASTVLSPPAKQNGSQLSRPEQTAVRGILAESEKPRNKTSKQTGDKRSREGDIASHAMPPSIGIDITMESAENMGTVLSPVSHAAESDDIQLDLSLDIGADSDMSEPSSPTTEFPGDTFAHPPKRLQSRRSGPPPTTSSQSWNSPNFWSHLDELDPELECRVSNPDENGDSGYQIVVTRINPLEQSTDSKEYAYYHEKKKNKVKLSTNPITVRELIPEMAENILKSKLVFKQENKTLQQALEADETKVLERNELRKCDERD